MGFSKKYLRPDEATITGEGAGGVDRWMIKADRGETRETVLAWFLAEPGAPIPGVSMAEFGNLFVLCESVNVSMHPKSRRLWYVTVNYVPFDVGSGGLPGGTGAAGAPINVTTPSPVGATPTNDIVPEDPDTWDPVVMRRASRRYKSVGEAYYEGGYSGYAHTWCNGKSVPATFKRCPVVNSAIVPIDSLPDMPSGGSTWMFRFLRKSIPDFSVWEAFENTIPLADITKVHKGMSIKFKKDEAICTSVEVSETYVNKEHAWSIEIQIETGNQIIELKDRGYEARALAAANDRQLLPPKNIITDTSSRVQKILDENGHQLSSPSLLNGNGAPLAENAEPIFGKWRFFDRKSWTDLLAPLNTP
jgi:hypothetical protein